MGLWQRLARRGVDEGQAVAGSPPEPPRRTDPVAGSAPADPVAASVPADRASPPAPATPADQRPVDLAPVDDLVAAGRLVEAVDLLASLNIERRDPALDVRLIDLRAEAARALLPGPGRSPWPPVYRDPFPDVVGRLPEIDAAELDSEVLGGAVAHHGALVVRGVFSEAQVRRSVEAIERTHHRQQDGADAPEAAVAHDHSASWYRPFPTDQRNDNLRRMVAQQGGTWLADSPSSTAQILHELDAAGVTGAIGGHLGERPFFSLQKSTLRRSLPRFNLVAWHQDGSFLDADVRTMNVWVALSPCGGDYPSPGLEVLPRRLPDILPVDGVMSTHSISYDLVDELAAEMPTVIPSFGPGDAILFDERFLHRTHLAESMTEIRYALECWFFAPSHQASSYTPLLV